VEARLVVDACTFLDDLGPITCAPKPLNFFEGERGQPCRRNATVHREAFGA
jgi:hypothetical protein